MSELLGIGGGLLLLWVFTDQNHQLIPAGMEVPAIVVGLVLIALGVIVYGIDVFAKRQRRR